MTKIPAVFPERVHEPDGSRTRSAKKGWKYEDRQYKDFSVLHGASPEAGEDGAQRPVLSGTRLF